MASFLDRYSALVIAWIAGCITALGIVYFITVKQDSTVLFTLSSILGGLIGYHAGKRRKR